MCGTTIRTDELEGRNVFGARPARRETTCCRLRLQCSSEHKGLLGRRIACPRYPLPHEQVRKLRDRNSGDGRRFWVGRSGCPDRGSGATRLQIGARGISGTRHGGRTGTGNCRQGTWEAPPNTNTGPTTSNARLHRGRGPGGPGGPGPGGPGTQEDQAVRDRVARGDREARGQADRVAWRPGWALGTGGPGGHEPGGPGSWGTRRARRARRTWGSGAGWAWWA